MKVLYGVLFAACVMLSLDFVSPTGTDNGDAGHAPLHTSMQAAQDSLGINVLEVYIKGDKNRVMKSQVEVLEAVVPHDSGKNKILLFWSSVRFNKEGENIGSCIDSGSPRTEHTLVVHATDVLGNVTCVITLTATSTAGISGSTTVSLTTVKQQPPQCHFENKRATVLPGDRVTLMVTCTSVVGVKDVTWGMPSIEGSAMLDLSAAVEDTYTDTLTNNVYKSAIVIGKGFLKAGKMYSLEARVTDMNSAETKNVVKLSVMDDVKGGEMTCPKSYVELDMLTIGVKDVVGPEPLTYTLYVQTSNGKYKVLSEKQKTGIFKIYGPHAYGHGNNVFMSEICTDGVTGICRKLSCKVQKVVSADDMKAVTDELEGQVESLRAQGRALEATVLLSTVYEKTGDNSLISKMLDMTRYQIGKNAMDYNSASTFLDLLLTIPPNQLSPDQITPLTTFMASATDFFLRDNKKLPERFISALDLWVVKAEAAGLSRQDVHTVAQKAVMAESSGLEVGNSQTHDLNSSYVKSFNDIPGNNVKVKDGNNNDIHITFGQGVREKVGHNNLKFKVRAYKNPPGYMLEQPVVAPVVDMSFFDSITGAEKTVSGLSKPASIYLTLNSEVKDAPVKCVYWCPTRRSWVTSGVETGARTSTRVECRTSHFSSYTVIHASQDYNRDHNTAWIVGTVLGVIIAMILIILLILLIYIKVKSRASRVDDSSRPHSRLSESPTGNIREKRENERDRRGDRGKEDERDGLTRSYSPEEAVTQFNGVQNGYEQRPGSGDGLKRSMY